MADYRDPGPIEFDAVIQRSTVVGAASFVQFPHSVPEIFGASGRVPVRAAFDGVGYRGSLVTDGDAHLLLVRSDIQAEIGKATGDTVRVSLTLDTSERVVELADDVGAALVAGVAVDAFRALAYSRQREYALWIASAKRQATRGARIARMLRRLADGSANQKPG
ncbi:YdeI/OmpD-associated family protein [Arthrobacter sp. H20]|uniref:YdeI/OmpD-associated family protein n=1 Tax=Arthrobacter sp. H20 TaxID=1267981 RepID=UPI0004B4C4BF|nr:YdeI/OmpD-associated family protein [Arthrobacter sp. H20]